ncbi:MAG: DUF1906 domain-containing protein [Lactobacillaceae bacterium]|nr:DUF1906 domain-containing protein [Lactobacillaceae bacterium]
MDEMVLETQKRVNTLGAGVAGFEAAPENGLTGWPTIYALIEELQHELGIATLSENFGPQTATQYDAQVTPNLKVGWSSNIVYLIQGAFWAKGINPGALDGVYSDDTIAAVKELQSDAGFTSPDGILSSEWAKALFDMSAFILVAGGDAKVRSIQQYLNVNYSDTTGILPTDGIYQRDTNTALIYAVQIELGLSDIANGVWGSTYASAYASGLSAKLIELIQFALYLNMAQYIETNGLTTVLFNGKLDSDTQSIIDAFQNFMKLDPVTSGEPDPVTVYSLMVSSGSPSRNFWGIDTSIQLTQGMINSLVAWEVDYVGRYLTGTVGSGASETPKNLTRSEAEMIVDAKLHLVPIYQDNYPELDYFTRAQGQSDARAALIAASALGLPAGTVIYFAIDMDMTDDDITSYGIPYFDGIASILDYGTEGNYYVPGVYGTRNVGTRLALESHSVYSYVSNMSTGYSGNLGFSQPLNWAFDQFAEDASGASGVADIDYVNVSHVDEGVTNLIAANQLSWIYGTEFSLLKQEYISGTLTWDGPEVTLYDNKLMKLTAQLTTSVTSGPGELEFEISGGKLADGFEASMQNSFGTQVAGKLGGTLEEVATSIDSGKLRMTFSISGTSVTLSLTFINYDGDVNGVEMESAIILNAVVNFIPVTETEAPDISTEFNNALSSIQNAITTNEEPINEFVGMAALLVVSGIALTSVTTYETFRTVVGLATLFISDWEKVSGVNANEA